MAKTKPEPDTAEEAYLQKSSYIFNDINKLTKILPLDKSTIEMVHLFKSQINAEQNYDVEMLEYIKSELVDIEYMENISSHILNSIFVIVMGIAISDYTFYDDDELDIRNVFGHFYPSLMGIDILKKLLLLCNSCFSYSKKHSLHLFKPLLANGLSGPLDKISNIVMELYDKGNLRLQLLLNVFDLKKKTKKIQGIVIEVDELTKTSEELQQYIDIARTNMETKLETRLQEITERNAEQQNELQHQIVEEKNEQEELKDNKKSQEIDKELFNVIESVQNTTTKVKPKPKSTKEKVKPNPKSTKEKVKPKPKSTKKKVESKPKSTKKKVEPKPKSTKKKVEPKPKLNRK